MASINVGDWKKGLKLEYNGEPYEILEVNFVKPGKGQAIYTTKMRNLLKGTIITNKYRSGDSLEGADVRKGPAQYSFRDGSNFVFMDVASFEQHPLPVESVEDRMKFLKEGDTVDLLFWNEQPIDMTPPSQVQLAVTYTEPAARGNTTSNVTKAATVETGAEVQVPAFIEEGNVIKIDTESGSYLERVSN